MRKIKLSLQCRVPSWNYCNYDGFTPDNRPSKDLCRFCQKTKAGYRCLLHERNLTSDHVFVHKTAECIKATAGFAVTVDEVVEPTIPPKTLVKHAIKNYKATVEKLVAQGYPRALAETVAEQYTLED